MSEPTEQEMQHLKAMLNNRTTSSPDGERP